MKARFIAMLFSLFVVTVSVQADTVPKKSTEQQLPLSNKINLNRADLSTLTGSFKGIGKKRAEAIIAYRESHKGFKSIEEFAEIKGFGQRFIDKNREHLKEVFDIS